MRRSQNGQVTAFVVVFVMALILVAGLVLDGGMLLAAQRRAANEAEAAARSGAQALDVAAYRASGVLALDPARASMAAQTYLAAVGHEGDVEVAGDRVAVTVRFRQPLQILDIAGLGALSVTGQGEARATPGVTEASP